MIFTFTWHLALAVGFMVILYLVATYSSLRHELAEVKRLKAKVEKALYQKVDKKELAYYKKNYNSEVKRFTERKHSPFAKIIVSCVKDLDQDFAYLD